MVSVVEISSIEVEKLLNIEEGHFSDLKSIDIKPGKLTKTISAFSNAEGGELYIGIEDESRQWRGFNNQEAANGHIQAFENLFPLGDGYIYTFLSNPEQDGLVLKVDVLKNQAIKEALDKKIYIRRGAQSLPVTNDE